MEDRGGRLELLLPYATLEPVRELLLQMFMGEKFGRDSIWESHLAGELWNTNIAIEAVLETFEASLRDVMNLSSRRPVSSSTEFASTSSAERSATSSKSAASNFARALLSDF